MPERAVSDSSGSSSDASGASGTSGLSDRAAVARTALLEITDPTTVGELVSESPEEDGVVTVLFEATMLGYPGWHWTVSVAQLDGEAPTVLEAELLPGDGALLAPDWTPWSERLEDYRAAQAAAAESDDESDDDAESDEDDDESEDEDDDADDAGDDDYGDDVYDGLDPETAAEAVNGDASDESDADETESDDDESDESDESKA